MYDHVNFVPVIEARTFELAIVDAKTERFNEMKGDTGGRAETCDIARIGWNLRLDERDMQRRAS